MSGKRFSETGNSVSEVDMSLSVVDESAVWADELMNAEWRGRGDREKSARHRLSRKIGVPESYLFRLKYKREGMSDVRGSVYRALMLGRQLYGLTCETIENAVARIERDAQEIEEANATDGSARRSLAGMEAASRRAAE